MVKSSKLFFLILLFTLGACSSRMKDEAKLYRSHFSTGDFKNAEEILNKSDLKKDAKSQLLWLLERGSLSLSLGDESRAIQEFQNALELIDQLYTKKISAKAASLIINDSSDVFYGASYERSFAHYFLAKSYYARYLKLKNKADLQSARATILAWDSYFAELQRSLTNKTIYQTDLMLKVFGGEVHEISEIRNDKQISLQLYKDALNILNTMGGAFNVFNNQSTEFIKSYESGASEKAYVKTAAYKDLHDFLVFKILSLTKEIRAAEFKDLSQSLKPSPEVLNKLNQPKSNIVILLEEGLIPQKIGKPFNFGLKGAVDAVENPGAKAFIATVGAEVITAFAMNTLGMRPQNFQTTGSFIFAHDVTRLAVQEASISFELPMIEETPVPQDLNLVVMNKEGKVLHTEPMAIVSENGALARIVLEEDVVSRYVKTGTRVAIKHLVAIVASMQIYQKLRPQGEFLAKSVAMATYIASSKGIAAFEKADTRYWMTLPELLRISEFALPPGEYMVGVSKRLNGGEAQAIKNLGSIKVEESGKSIHHLKFINL